VSGVVQVLTHLINRAFGVAGSREGASRGGVVDQQEQRCGYSDVIDELLLRKAADAEIARTIVSCFPLEGLIDLIDQVSSVWGEKLFVSRGEMKMQNFLTETLLASLERVDSSLLMRSGERRIPLIISLSSGVSTYLDATDKRSRILGMKVARRFSAILGQEINFAELDEVEMNEHSVSYSSKEGQSNIGKFAEIVEEEEKEKADSHVPEDESSDSELEAYEIGEENVGVASSTNYLRTCLEMLQYADTKPDSRDKQETGLISIPKLLMTNPSDAPEVTPLLMRELMRLSNSFNVENFEELRNEAIHSLLTLYPENTVSVVTGAIDSNALMLGARLSAITALIKAAHVLANLPFTDSTVGMLLPSVVPSVEETAQISTIAELSSSTQISQSKTRIKRPLKLAASKRQKKYFRNNFGPLAPKFYFPLLKTLAAQKQSGGEAIVEDGVEALLTAQILSALGYFAKCSVNTHHQRTLIEHTIAVATSVRDSTSLGIRRAALFAIYNSISAWVLQRSEALRNRPAIGGALEVLSDLSGSNSARFSSNVPSIADGELGRAVANVVDWALASAKEEADPQSRILKIEIVKAAITLDESTAEDD